MFILKTNVEGLAIIKPRLFKDARGYFFESFSQREFEEKVRKVNFVQDNESMSSYGVMRGLHFQKPPFAQSKLVRCVKGRVLDVAVDIRKGSPTYGEHVAVELSEDNHLQFDGGISILDEGIGIDWKIPADKAILSEKDTKHPLLRDFESPFEYGMGLYE